MTYKKGSLHQTATEGYQKISDIYVRGRPDYPPEITSWLQDTLNLNENSLVVDLGAGTGKFIPYLLETNAEIIAVEPVPEMLEQLTSKYNKVKALSGTAEQIPLSDNSVDVVVAAQAFHWFATEKSLSEIYRILKPNGKLGLIWNLRDDGIKWVAKFNEIVNQAEKDVPRYYTGEWRKVFPFHGFTSLHEVCFFNKHIGTPEDVILNRFRSMSFIATLPENERNKLEKQILSLIAETPELNNQSEVNMPYKTSAFYVQKLG